ncbi:unnamed protein product, partial [Mesorhabditis belari]|uniref:C2H2-type domain-containing protein n=1 Tax=Mesorhabditis belari TaxID=2138241 RepID=A0AAF3EHI6_9BILA
MLGNYGVAFTCSECDHFFQTLEVFERHIWSRHLRNFPYRCAQCGFPALNVSTLSDHYLVEHGTAHAPEFKRKIADERKLWGIISQSMHIEVGNNPFEEDGGPNYGVSNDFSSNEIRESEHRRNKAYSRASVWQVDAATGGEMKIVSHELQVQRRNTWVQQIDSGMQGSLQNETLAVPHLVDDVFQLQQVENPMHAIDGEAIELSNEPLRLEANGRPVMILPSSGGGIQNDEDDNLTEQGSRISVAAEEEVFEEEGEIPPNDNSNIMMDDGGPGTSYEDYYSGNDYAEEGEAYEYVDDEGNPVYLESEFMNKGSRDLRLSLLKDRHMELIIRKIASGPKKPLSMGHRCEICGKVNKYLSKALEHQRSHTGEKPFKCPHCRAGFTQRGALTSHIRLHTGERPYSCSWECGKTFVSSSACKLHEKSHAGEKRYNCESCGKLFGKRYHLERHLKTVHFRQYMARINGLPPPPPALEGLAAAEEDEPKVRNAVLAVIDAVREDKMPKEALFKRLQEEI